MIRAQAQALDKSSMIIMAEVQRIPSMLNTIQSLIDGAKNRVFADWIVRWKANAGSGKIVAVSSEVAAEISTFYERDASLGLPRDSIGERTAGGVTFIQRFNSALTLSPHIHVVFMDGEFAETADARRFLGVQYFNSSSVILILNRIIKRLERLFRD